MKAHFQRQGEIKLIKIDSFDDVIFSSNVKIIFIFILKIDHLHFHYNHFHKLITFIRFIVLIEEMFYSNILFTKK